MGADVESICSKCGDVWHVVVAKVGDKIARVICKECGSEHRPRATGAGAAKSSPSPRPRAPGKPGALRGAVPGAVIDDNVPMVVADTSRPIRSYRASESFAIADRVSHPTFGVGVVESSPGPGKTQVFFPGGRRVLAQAKASSSLERPGVTTAYIPKM